MGGIGSFSLITIPLLVVSCSRAANNENTKGNNSSNPNIPIQKDQIPSVTEYISQLTLAQLSVTSLGSQSLASVVNSNNINQYISGFPQQPNGVSLNYKFSPDNTSGTLIINISLEMNINGVTTPSVSIPAKTITGFLNGQSSNTLTQWINNFNNAGLSASNIGATIFPSNFNNEINNSNYTYSQLIDGIPNIPSNISVSYQITPDNTNGTINIVANASNPNTGNSLTSNEVIATGFLNQTNVNNQAIQYINNINNLNLTLNSSITNILPQNVNNISSYITNLPAIPVGVNLTYQTTPNNQNGSMVITITASVLGQQEATSNQQNLSGFLTMQQAVNNLINQVNSTKLAVTQSASQTLPSNISTSSTWSGNFILNDLSNFPNIMNGIQVSSTMTYDDATGTIILTISATGQGATSTSATPQTIGGFASYKSAVSQYISSINSTSLNTTNGNLSAQNIYPSELNAQNILQYISNIPSPQQGINVTYKITPNNKQGTLNLIINASAKGVAEESSSVQLITGFSTSGQIVAQYINNFENASLTGQGEELPSIVTSQNINQYISGLPAIPQGVNVTYTISNVVNTSGTLSLSVSASAPDAQIQNSQVQVINSGFLTTNQVQTSINNYINSLNGMTLTITSLAANALPSAVTSNNINQYISNLPTVPAGVSITYQLSPSDQAGLLDFTITAGATAPNATQISPVTSVSNSTQGAMSVSGFLNQAQYNVNQYVNSINNITLQVNNTLADQQIPSNINSNNIASYLSNLPANSNNVTLAYTFTYNDAEGSLTVTIEVSQQGPQGVYNSTTVKTITQTITGFLTNSQANSALDKYINLINNTHLVASSQASTILPSSVTSENINQYIANMPSIPGFANVSIKYSPENTVGSLGITISASFNKKTETAKEQIIKGFLNTNQNAINQYINSFKTNESNFQINPNITAPLASTINDKNYTSIISGIPSVSTGINVKFDFQANDAAGTIKITAIASADDAISSSISTVIDGFETSSTYLNNFINNLISIVGNGSISADSAAANVLPSEVNNSNIEQYIQGTSLQPTSPLPQGFKIEYQVSQNSSYASSGYININVIVSATGVPAINFNNSLAQQQVGGPLMLSGFKAINAQ